MAAVLFLPPTLAICCASLSADRPLLSATTLAHADLISISVALKLLSRPIWAEVGIWWRSLRRPLLAHWLATSVHVHMLAHDNDKFSDVGC